jgi:mono/diheme cytochrome c family protein
MYAFARTLLIVTTMLVAAGCSKSDSSSSEEAPRRIGAAPAKTASAEPDEAAVGKAKEIFAQRCTPCHGPEGRGDGPASAGLTPKPRNFHDTDWQAQVTDDHIQTIIKLGGAAVGKSPTMPGNPDLNDGQVIAGLRTVIRGFRQN